MGEAVFQKLIGEYKIFNEQLTCIHHLIGLQKSIEF